MTRRPLDEAGRKRILAAAADDPSLSAVVGGPLTLQPISPFSSGPFFGSVPAVAPLMVVWPEGALELACCSSKTQSAVRSALLRHASRASASTNALGALFGGALLFVLEAARQAPPFPADPAGWTELALRALSTGGFGVLSVGLPFLFFDAYLILRHPPGFVLTETGLSAHERLDLSMGMGMGTRTRRERR